jgi:hypothetical protein
LGFYALRKRRHASAFEARLALQFITLHITLGCLVVGCIDLFDNKKIAPMAWANLGFDLAGFGIGCANFGILRAERRRTRAERTNSASQDSSSGTTGTSTAAYRDQPPRQRSFGV